MSLKKDQINLKLLKETTKLVLVNLYMAFKTCNMFDGNVDDDDSFPY